MIVKAFLYGYATGLRSARRLARARVEDVAFRVLAANNSPDFRTLSEFRWRHLPALPASAPPLPAGGLVKLGTVALDSTKIEPTRQAHGDELRGDRLLGARVLRTGALLLVLLLGLPPLSPAEEEAAPPPDHPVTRVVETVVTDTVYLLTAPLRLDRETAVLAGGLTLGLTALFLADREIRDRVQAATGPTGRDVADSLTTAGDVGVLVGLNAALLALGLVQEQATGETRLRDASLVALEAQLFTALLTSGFKHLTGRARPDAGQGAHRFDPFDRDDALPSGHASRAFAVAAVFADRYGGPVPILACGAAGLVAASRVVLDRHWASDVVAGSVLGIVVGRSLSRRHAENRRGFDFFPVVTGDGTVAVAAGVRF